MKKKIILILFLVFVSSLFLLLNRDLFIRITSPLRVEIQDEIKSLGLDKINLILSDDLIHHFKDLYKGYKLEENHTFEYQQWLAYYKLNNSWKTAELQYHNKTYKIKIKSHGKTPSNHKERDYISLSIQLLDNEKIKGVNRFNLIVYWRIKQFDYEYYSSIAKKIGVKVQREDLILVNINEQEKYKLFYFEFRPEIDYLSKLVPENLIALKRSNNKSLLYFEGNINHLNRQIKKEINSAEHSHLSIKEKKIIDSIFNSINSALYKNEYKNIHHYFDLNYISRVSAMISLSGTPDGFEMCNLICPLNVENQMFYPIIHRDCELKPINNPNHIEKCDKHYSLLRMLNQNDSIRLKKYQILHDFIAKTDLDSLSKVLDSISCFHENLYYSSSIKYFLGLHSHPPIIHNMNQIKKYISTSNPEISYKEIENGIILNLHPKSMSPLNFSKICLTDQNFSFPTELNINVTKNNHVIISKSLKINADKNPVIDLLPIFKNISFYDTLNDELEITNVVYEIKITTTTNDLERVKLNKKNLRISMINKISNSSVIIKTLTDVQ